MSIKRYGGAVAIQYEGPDKVEPEKLLASFEWAAQVLRRNYVESCALLGLDPSTTTLNLDYDHGKGQYRMEWEASR